MNTLFVVAVFDVQRAYFYAEEKRDTFVELPDFVPAEFWTAHVGKLLKACFHNELCSVTGTVHGDDIFVACPRQDVVKWERHSRKNGRPVIR